MFIVFICVVNLQILEFIYDCKIMPLFSEGFIIMLEVSKLVHPEVVFRGVVDHRSMVPHHPGVYFFHLAVDTEGGGEILRFPCIGFSCLSQIFNDF